MLQSFRRTPTDSDRRTRLVPMHGVRRVGRRAGREGQMENVRRRLGRAEMSGVQLRCGFFGRHRWHKRGPDSWVGEVDFLRFAQGVGGRIARESGLRDRVSDSLMARSMAECLFLHGRTWHARLGIRLSEPEPSTDRALAEEVESGRRRPAGLHPRPDRWGLAILTVRLVTRR